MIIFTDMTLLFTFPSTNIVRQNRVKSDIGCYFFSKKSGGKHYFYFNNILIFTKLNHRLIFLFCSMEKKCIFAKLN